MPEHSQKGRGLLSAFGYVRMSKGHCSCVFRAESYDLAQMLLQSLPSEARPSQAWGKPENTRAGRLRQGRLPLTPHAPDWQGETHSEESFHLHGLFTVVQTGLKRWASRKAADGRRLLWDAFWTSPSNILVLN